MNLGLPINGASAALVGRMHRIAFLTLSPVIADGRRRSSVWPGAAGQIAIANTRALSGAGIDVCLPVDAPSADGEFERYLFDRSYVPVAGSEVHRLSPPRQGP